MPIARALPALMLYGVVCAQAPSWTSAQIDAVCEQFQQRGASQALCESLQQAAKATPKRAFLLVDTTTQANDYSATATWSVEVICLQRVGAESSAKAFRSMSALRVKARALERRWRDVATGLAYPDLAQIPASFKGTIRPGTTLADWAGEGYAAALIRAEGAALTLDPDTLSSFLARYRDGLEQQAIAAHGRGDQDLLRGSLDEYSTTTALPAKLQPYRLWLKLLQRDGAEVVAEFARQMQQRWRDEGIEDARAWIELAAVFLRVNDAEGAAAAVKQARSAALSTLGERTGTDRTRRSAPLKNGEQNGGK